MKLSEVLIKPILSEKINQQTEKLNRYAFVVNRKANKLEIKKAVEDFYGVQVAEVNTAVIPGKAKSRNTKAGVVSGRKSAKKKAYVTVVKGESIDLYSTTA
jgi:large subunit ribosomal protein L23